MAASSSWHDYDEDDQPYLHLVNNEPKRTKQEALMAPGDHLGSIHVGKAMSDECSDGYRDQGRFLRDLNDKNKLLATLQRRVFFGQTKERTDLLQMIDVKACKLPSTATQQEMYEWIQAQPKYSDGSNYYVSQHYVGGYYSTHCDDQALQTLKQLSVPADFGDLMVQATRVDAKVRRGRQIAFNDVLSPKILSVPNTLVTELQGMFGDLTGVHGATIKPYKVNLYEQGDFFTMHRDSPEPNLLATMLVLLYGDGKSLEVDGKPWNTEPYNHGGNVCVFWTDVLHEIKPVASTRVTLAFKVFAPSPDVPDTLSKVRLSTFQFHLDLVSSLLKMRIQPEKHMGDGAGILLQNGYAYLNNMFSSETSMVNLFHGFDRVLYQACEKVFGETHRLVFVPVVVANHWVDRNYNQNYRYSYRSSSSDDDSGHSEEDEENEDDKDAFKFTRFGYHDYRASDEDSRSLKSCDAHLARIDVCGISEALADAIESSPQYFESDQLRLVLDDVHPPIYSLGNGYRVGEVIERDCFIGNQYDGLLENILYHNLMLYLEPKPSPKIAESAASSSTPLPSDTKPTIFAEDW